MECANVKVSVDSGSLRVRDVMLARPKTLGADATVGDLRRLFANEHVRTAILAEDDAFIGSVEQGQLEPSLPDGAPARDLVLRPNPATIGPDATVAEAMRRLDELGGRRLVVVGDDGRLEGLLCLNSSRTGFCQ